ncbi:MAG: Magnesium and cobalt transport protein CorA [uncultured Rubrobacteraceae bacterium]|uniref:Magnesium transport protein CorA n=1 Tax=uncultured Rubrobacteraceae bacterium TaxID=349277 RepID=A0A6J4QUX7_9ACTN|nr:MAG: Magnesium and cobalt transport protein CorA [uncultured Rubrobacteraceae bacterium]
MPVIVDNAIYVDGRREKEPPSLEETYEACREKGGFAWIGLYEPTEEEFETVAGEFDLHELAVEDAITAHQRPKIERYGGSVFVVLKSARYRDETETVEFGEIHAFVGPGFIITVRHGKASELHEVRERLESEPDLLRRGPAAVMYAIMDRVVDDYAPVSEGLEMDIDQIEAEVFGGNASVSRRIYALSREVIGFRRATQPLNDVLERMIEGEVYDFDPELHRYLRDVQDHALRVTEQVEAFRELLSNILSVNLTLVSINQNDEVKKISAWAAILFTPTLVASIYGMNFEVMPELTWMFGYPFALALMVVTAFLLYRIFRKAGWL